MVDITIRYGIKRMDEKGNWVINPIQYETREQAEELIGYADRDHFRLVRILTIVDEV